MSSEYVASKVVQLAKYPRRKLIIPWWANIAVTFVILFPTLVDRISYFFAKRKHKIK
jgi:short-subunit dehydrogenase